MVSKELNDFDSGVNSADRNPLRECREVDSAELLRGERQVVIRHGDESYRLILTRNGRLILQK